MVTRFFDADAPGESNRPPRREPEPVESDEPDGRELGPPPSEFFAPGEREAAQAQKTREKKEIRKREAALDAAAKATGKPEPSTSPELRELQDFVEDRAQSLADVENAKDNSVNRVQSLIDDLPDRPGPPTKLGEGLPRAPGTRELFQDKLDAALDTGREQDVLDELGNLLGSQAVAKELAKEVREEALRLGLDPKTLNINVVVAAIARQIRQGKKVRAKKIAELVAKQAKAEREFASKTVLLPSGESVAIKDFNKLTERQQTVLKASGIAGLRAFIQAELEAFEREHVKLDNGEYVTKKEFDKLDAQGQDTLRAVGVDGFNAMQFQEFSATKKPKGKLPPGISKAQETEEIGPQDTTARRPTKLAPGLASPPIPVALPGPTDIEAPPVQPVTPVTVSREVVVPEFGVPPVRERATPAKAEEPDTGIRSTDGVERAPEEGFILPTAATAIPPEPSAPVPIPVRLGAPGELIDVPTQEEFRAMEAARAQANKEFTEGLFGVIPIISIGVFAANLDDMSPPEQLLNGAIEVVAHATLIARPVGSLLRTPSAIAKSKAASKALVASTITPLDDDAGRAANDLTEAIIKHGQAVGSVDDIEVRFRGRLGIREGEGVDAGIRTALASPDTFDADRAFILSMEPKLREGRLTEANTLKTLTTTADEFADSVKTATVGVDDPRLKELDGQSIVNNVRATLQRTNDTLPGVLKAERGLDKALDELSTAIAIEGRSTSTSGLKRNQIEVGKKAKNVMTALEDVNAANTAQADVLRSRVFSLGETLRIASTQGATFEELRPLKAQISQLATQINQLDAGDFRLLTKGEQALIRAVERFPANRDNWTPAMRQAAIRVIAINRQKGQALESLITIPEPPKGVPVGGGGVALAPTKPSDPTALAREGLEGTQVKVPSVSAPAAAEVVPSILTPAIGFPDPGVPVEPEFVPEFDPFAPIDPFRAPETPPDEEPAPAPFAPAIPELEPLVPAEPAPPGAPEPAPTPSTPAPVPVTTPAPAPPPFVPDPFTPQEPAPGEDFDPFVTAIPLEIPSLESLLAPEPEPSPGTDPVTAPTLLQEPQREPAPRPVETPTTGFAPAPATTPIRRAKAKPRPRVARTPKGQRKIERGQFPQIQGWRQGGGKRGKSQGVFAYVDRRTGQAVFSSRPIFGIVPSVSGLSPVKSHRVIRRGRKQQPVREITIGNAVAIVSDSGVKFRGRKGGARRRGRGGRRARR